MSRFIDGTNSSRYIKSIAGDIESLREWIVPGKNGLLVDPEDPFQLAEAIILSLKDRELRSEAARHNIQLIDDKASYQVVMANAEKFYRSLISTRFDEKLVN